MKLAIVSDEISPEFSTAVELGTDWGIRNFEIRSLSSGRLPYISERDRRELLRVKEEAGIEVTALSPGAFKVPVESEDVRRQMDDMLPRTYALAHALGVDKVVIFGFRKPKEMDGAACSPQRNYPGRIVALLAEVAERAKQEGIRLVLENEPVCWADSGSTTAEMLREVGHENLWLNWDPCNALTAGGAPYPEEYEGLKDLIGHLHIKDAVRSVEGHRYVPVGEGAVDWRGQLSALRRDGFEGHYTVETHFGPRVKASKACVDRLKALLLEVA